MNQVVRASESINAVNCRMSWLIFASRFATESEVELIKLQLPIHLAELEAVKLEYFSCTDQSSSASGCVRKICEDLKVFRGQAIDSGGLLPNITIQYA
ncbi:MAG: hypothetical protein ABSB30_10740 [Terracidiphilus sp.]|jgi:hypothetical protein